MHCTLCSLECSYVSLLLSIYIYIGREVWRVSYNSPVVGVFVLEGMAMRKVPLYTVALESIDVLRESAALALRANTVGIKAFDASLQ